MAKYLDENGLLYFWGQLKSLFAGKVDKETGKGLSSNDFTSDEKTKLANIAAGAEVNVNADWKATTGDAAILNKPTIPTKVSELTNDSGYLTEYTETDPTVPAWAKASSKPSYTAQEVGALPSTTYIPTATSDLTNDSGFITAEALPTPMAPSTTSPKMDGTAAVGNETKYARGDHTHPTDTSRAPIASPEFTGTPKAPTAATGTNTTQIATTAYVQTELGSYAKKTDISSAYIYKGSVATYSLLPASGQTAGDVYNVEADGMNYAWTGSAWDALGSTFTITSITNSEIDTIVAS